MPEEILTISDLREVWEYIVNDNEKYDGEARYVPYLWEVKSPDEEMESGKYRFYPEADDIRLFPELRGRRKVTLQLCDDATVREVYK